MAQPPIVYTNQGHMPLFPPTISGNQTQATIPPTNHPTVFNAPPLHYVGQHINPPTNHPTLFNIPPPNYVGQQVNQLQNNPHEGWGYNSRNYVKDIAEGPPLRYMHGSEVSTEKIFDAVPNNDNQPKTSYSID